MNVDGLLKSVLSAAAGLRSAVEARWARLLPQLRAVCTTGYAAVVAAGQQTMRAAMAAWHHGMTNVPRLREQAAAISRDGLQAAVRVSRMTGPAVRSAIAASGPAMKAMGRQSVCLGVEAWRRSSQWLRQQLDSVRSDVAEVLQPISQQQGALLEAVQQFVRRPADSGSESLGTMLRRRAAELVQQLNGLIERLKRLEDTKRTLPSAKHLSWTLRFWVQRMGVSGVVGLGLCAFAAMFYLSAVLAMEAEQAQVMEDLETAQADAQGLGGDAEAPRTPREQLADFYAVFPPAWEMPETVRKLNQLAERHHLVLRAGDYHVTDDHTGRLVRYDVSFPIAGSYPQVREFLRTVLAEVPSVALDKVDVEKNMTDGAHAKTTVSFSLYSRRNG